jgi:hypothetical protein
MGCNSAPGQSSCTFAASSKGPPLEHHLELSGIPRPNPITQYRPNADILINGTSDGHIFHDGYVIRWIAVDSLNNVRIWTSGAGINTATSVDLINRALGQVNYTLGKKLFENKGKENVKNVRSKLGL